MSAVADGVRRVVALTEPEEFLDAGRCVAEGALLGASDPEWRDLVNAVAMHRRGASTPLEGAVTQPESQATSQKPALLRHHQ